ncbi:MAG: hypothetical protein M1840_007868 [Geoglossum simile]|nr:MAG: hypothetical protein M1840_007868 [Geoglossum simile]
MNGVPPNPSDDSRSQSTATSFPLNERTTLSYRSSSRVTSPDRKCSKRSPTRNMSDLKAAMPRIELFQIGSGGHDLPQHAKALWKNIAPFGKGIGVLPGCLKTEINKLCGFDQPTPFFDESTLPASEQDRRLLECIQWIHAKAASCNQLDKPEASWGEEVVRPLLDLAVTHHEQKVQVENVTTTRIFPTNLIPLGIHGLPSDSKRVDYCMFLSQNRDQEDWIRKCVEYEPIDEQGINQTDAGYIKWLPEFASFELKKENNSRDPLLQLAIWNTALSSRLACLQQPNSHPVELMPLPVVKIVGHDWKICYTYINEKGESILRGPDHFGSTLDVQGICRIIKGLEGIIRYGVEEYSPWFRENILWERLEQ